MNKDIVLVTGFGPFRDHNVNASWESVKLLPSIDIQNVHVEIAEIPVLYKYVEEQIQRLWDTHKPKLVVHVGVSSYASKITIEKQASRTGYSQPDCNGEYHPTGECCPEGNNTIQCLLNLEKICEEVNSIGNVSTCISTNAGRYLCEFIYYKSLNINQNNTIFVHVPPLNMPLSAAELATGLAQIIKCSLKQIDQATCQMDIVL